MKKIVSLVSATFILACTNFANAALIAQWTFEDTDVLPQSNLTDLSYGAADGGANAGSGAASGHHSSSATDWSFPAGAGSARSFSANTWAVGDYYQFQVSTVGYDDIRVVFTQTSSGTGPRDFMFQYSTDGSTFTDFATYAVRENASPGWSPTLTPEQAALFTLSFDLSDLTTLDNQATVFFRLTDNGTTSAAGGTVAAGGTDRVDNFAVVPEPTTYAGIIFGAIFCGTQIVRRLRARNPRL